jgi:hypothetical protein
MPGWQLVINASCWATAWWLTPCGHEFAAVIADGIKIVHVIM